MGRATRAARRSAIAIANGLLNRAPIVSMVGWLNRRRPFIHSVFVAYPATSEYASYYFTDKMMESARWNPVLCGVLRQNGSWAVGTGITSTERDLRRRGNEAQLSELVANAADLARRLGAKQVTYSGVLPGLLEKRGIVTEPIEAQITAEVVARAVETLDAGHPGDLRPLIVIGGRGFVGAELCRAVAGRDVYPVDLGDGWPEHLTGQDVIVVNVATRRALRQYIERFWPGVVVLNEVYPEPPDNEIAELERRGIPVFHVVGVEATAVPAMPKAYRGAIPCCAAWLHPDLKPVVRELTAPAEVLAA